MAEWLTLGETASNVNIGFHLTVSLPTEGHCFFFSPPLTLSFPHPLCLSLSLPLSISGETFYPLEYRPGCSPAHKNLTVDPSTLFRGPALRGCSAFFSESAHLPRQSRTPEILTQQRKPTKKFLHYTSSFLVILTGQRKSHFGITKLYRGFDYNATTV